MTTVEHADSRTFEAVVLLYLACSKLPDGDLDDSEGAKVLELTRAHSTGLADSYATAVIADAAASLASQTEPQAMLAKIVAAAETVGADLDATAKRQIVADLESIASADGTVAPQERSFIDAVAQTFRV